MSGTSRSSRVAVRAAQPMAAPADDPVALLPRIDAALYSWDLETDALMWAGPLPSAVAALGSPLSGAGWEALVSRDAVMGRAAAIRNGAGEGDGSGGSYELEYALEGRDGTPVWIEDVGVWTPGRDGRPARAQGLIRVVTARHEQHQRLFLASRIDESTGTLSRQRILDVLEDGILTAVRGRSAVAFAVAALEFERAPEIRLNEVMAALAQRIKATMRAGDTIGRLAPDSFGLVLADCSYSDLAVAARRIQDVVLSAPLETPSGPVAAQVSLAGVVAPKHGRTAQELAPLAEDTLAMVRLRRPGTFMPFRPSIDGSSLQQRNLDRIEALQVAIDTGRVALFLQPIVCARTGAVRWYECLGRLRGASGAYESLSHHVQAAERLGMVHILDRCVLELSVQQLLERPRLTLAINVSADTTTDPVWRERLHALVSGRPDVAARLIVEITETAAMTDLREATAFVNGLKSVGVRVALDDFGAGNTSFKQLRALKVDIVKIDGAFVPALASSPDDRAFVRAMVALSRETGMETVAECVETEDSAAILRDLGVDYLQGNLFGAPGLSPG